MYTLNSSIAGFRFRTCGITMPCGLVVSSGLIESKYSFSPASKCVNL